MTDEKRYADTYEIIRSFSIGKVEIVIGEDHEQELPYIVAFYESNGIIGRYFQVEGSKDYAEIVEIFGERISKEAAKIRTENDRALKDIDRTPITKDTCHPVSYKDDLNEKIIVIDSSVLKREYALPHYQIMFCTGGFGASANSRGSAVFCTNLFSGRDLRYERRDVLGTLQENELPDWAKEKYQEALQHEKKKPPASREER